MQIIHRARDKSSTHKYLELVFFFRSHSRYKPSSSCSSFHSINMLLFVTHAARTRATQGAARTLFHFCALQTALLSTSFLGLRLICFFGTPLNVLIVPPPPHFFFFLPSFELLLLLLLLCGVCFGESYAAFLSLECVCQFGRLMQRAASDPCVQCSRNPMPAIEEDESNKCLFFLMLSLSLSMSVSQ